MGAIVNAMPTRKDFVDFRAVGHAARNSLEFIIPKLLPGGNRA